MAERFMPLIVLKKARRLSFIYHTMSRPRSIGMKE